MKNDVFISYEHTSKNIADQICLALERHNIKCFYAPRDIIGDYATSIVDAIEATKIIIVILDSKSSNSIHVLNEVEIAYKKIIEEKSQTLILPFRISNDELSKAMNYYINRMHWINAADCNIDDAILELVDKVDSYLNEKTTSNNVTRSANLYFNDEKDELERLKKQNTLFKKYDSILYDQVKDLNELYILDIGSSDGDLIIDRFNNNQKVKKIIGIEVNQEAVDRANLNYKNEDIQFYCGDVESKDFDKQLNNIVLEHNIKKFNVINLSMVILHLEKPQKLFMILRKYLSNDGYILIKDIDDGLNIIYPDKNEYFEKAFNICKEESLSGYRYSGREIPCMLKKCGIHNIKILLKGISTEQLDFDEKDTLFQIYFTSILTDCKMLEKRNPKQAAKYLDFFNESYNDMYNEFLEDDCFFNLGFILFVAKIN